MSVKLECFYPFDNINEYVPDDVFRFYHFNLLNKQVTIVHNKYGFSVRCLNFAPSFFKGKQKYNTWYQVTEYLKNLETAVFFFSICVSEILFTARNVTYQNELQGATMRVNNCIYCYNNEVHHVL